MAYGWTYDRVINENFTNAEADQNAHKSSGGSPASSSDPDLILPFSLTRSLDFNGKEEQLLDELLDGKRRWDGVGAAPPTDFLENDSTQDCFRTKGNDRYRLNAKGVYFRCDFSEKTVPDDQPLTIARKCQSPIAEITSSNRVEVWTTNGDHWFKVGGAWVDLNTNTGQLQALQATAAITSIMSSMKAVSLAEKKQRCFQGIGQVSGALRGPTTRAATAGTGPEMDAADLPAIAVAAQTTPAIHAQMTAAANTDQQAAPAAAATADQQRREALRRGRPKRRGKN
ncbi:MAG: hypothetical protein M1827_001749 [Pycnora praestabilis]|nr:MAG: hypothetical protein M1827_001749 [Pycnora praestabilis]